MTIVEYPQGVNRLERHLIPHTIPRLSRSDIQFDLDIAGHLVCLMDCYSTNITASPPPTLAFSCEIHEAPNSQLRAPDFGNVTTSALISSVVNESPQMDIDLLHIITVFLC